MSSPSRQFAALGDPTRLAILDRLFQEGEVSAGELGSVAEISAPAISRHLKVLRLSGLVLQRSVRQKRLYSVNPKAMSALDDWMRDRRAFWEASLDRLEEALDASQDAEGA